MKNVCRLICLGIISVCACLPALASDQWVAPTPDELKMTSIPQVPGATAVYLDLEQTTDDRLRMFSYYIRLKVLTEGGKDYANVELPYFSNLTDQSVDNIAGRTIQPDGTIVPFSGKPYDKLIVKGNGFKYKAKVFTLPAVEVGSILEYRYKIHYSDNYYINPNWHIQSDLYLRKAHYEWIPTGRDVISNEDGGSVSNTVAWTPILPEGAAVKESSVAGVDTITLNVADVPPVPKEAMMPPIDSLSYRVLFYYTGFRTTDEYWKSAGSRWAGTCNKFIGPNGKVKDAVAALNAPGQTQDQMLRKIYAEVMTFENTDFTHQQTVREDKAHGFKEAATSADILERKRGTGDQLTELFVAMARSAGMKAYVMAVADRSKRFFLPSYLSMSQLDDLIAIVNVDGKDVYFDPGERYTAYEHLDWVHMYSGGIRQLDKGVALGTTAGEPFTNNHSSRIADLTLDDHGVASGMVTLSYQGNEALYWRQRELRGDVAGLKQELRTSMEHTLPGGMDVEVTDVANVENPDQPLKVIYHVHGAVGTPVGKRLLVPVDLFESGKTTLFPQPKRETSIDLHFASYVQDAIRYTLPASFAVESLPDPAKELYEHEAGFTMSSKRSGNSVTFYRNVSMAKVLVVPKEYPEFRTFYSKLEARGQDSMVLTRASDSGAGVVALPLTTH